MTLRSLPEGQHRIGASWSNCGGWQPICEQEKKMKNWCYCRLENLIESGSGRFRGKMAGFLVVEQKLLFTAMVLCTLPCRTPSNWGKEEEVGSNLTQKVRSEKRGFTKTRFRVRHKIVKEGYGAATCYHISFLNRKRQLILNNDVQMLIWFGFENGCHRDLEISIPKFHINTLTSHRAPSTSWGL